MSLEKVGGDGLVCETVQLDGHGLFGDLSARHGAGFAMIFVRDYDPCEFRRRDYSGAWSDPQPCSEMEYDWQSQLSFEALPPYGELDYGGLLISSDVVPGGAYFFRAPVLFLDGFEGGTTNSWSFSS